MSGGGGAVGRKRKENERGGDNRKREEEGETRDEKVRVAGPSWCSVACWVLMWAGAGRFHLVCCWQILEYITFS